MPEPSRIDPVSELVRSLREQIARKDERIARLETLLRDATSRLAQIEGRTLLADPVSSPVAPHEPQPVPPFPSKTATKTPPPESRPLPLVEEKLPLRPVSSAEEFRPEPPQREITPTLDGRELRRRHAEMEANEEWLKMLRPGSQ